MNTKLNVQLEELLSLINSQYNLGLHSAEKVTKGFLSENHIVTQGDKKYFLKRYRFDNKERIEEVHSVKKYFSEGGIPVILPFDTKEQKTYFFFNNGYYALFPFITDKEFDRGSLPNEAIVSLGEMLGRIHLLGKAAKLPIKERFKAWNKEKTLEKINAISQEIGKISNLSNFDKNALKSIETKKRLIEANTITYEDLNLPSDHLIHGDYLDHNVFFNNENKVSYVFDFEKTDYSPRMYELFRSLMYSFLSRDFRPEDIQKAKLYLSSYLNIYPTSEDELRRGLRLFCIKSIHGVWVEGEHYLNKSDRVDEFLLNDFKRIEYFSENFDEFQKDLLG